MKDVRCRHQIPRGVGNGAIELLAAQLERGGVVGEIDQSAFASKLPTIAESGLPNFSAEAWNGIMAPAGTPEPIVQRIAGALASMAKDPAVSKAMGAVGATTVSTTPDEYKKKIAQELEQWSELVKEFQKK